MTKKMTYATAINSAIDGTLTEEGKDRLRDLLISLEKRNKKGGERKPTKTQRENAVLSEDIWAYVSEDGEKRATEVAIYFGLSCQKASALLNGLVHDGRLEKHTDKRVTCFRVPEGM